MLETEDFVKIGFGPVQSTNLFEALRTSRYKSVEDWRFLAAFGIGDLGVGDSRRLLQHIDIDSVVDVGPQRIAEIKGFGDTTSRSIAQGLGRIKDTILHMLDLGFTLEKTPVQSDSTTMSSAVAGKRMVFTGKMLRGSRQEIQNSARQLGATVQTAVSGTTDFLVCGQNVGPKKLEKASRLGINIISEDEFYEMIDQ